MTFPVFIKASKTRVSIAKEIKEVNRLRMQFERSMTSRLMLVFKRTGKSASAEYMRSGDIYQSLIPLENDLRKVFEASYRAVIEKFADRVYTNRKADRFSQLVFDYTFMNAGAKITGIAETTGKLINKAILDGEKEGLGASKIGKLIQERTFGSIGRSRAVTIARTETHAAASFATDTATRELALPAQRKRWVSVSDARTRTGHSAANGQEVGIDEKFLVPYKGATVEMSYPHDGSGGAGNNINCRCLAIYFTDEDALFDDATPVTPVAPVVPVAPDIPDQPSIPTVERVVISDLIINIKTKKKLKEFDDHINDNTNDLQKRVINKAEKPTNIKNDKRGRYFSDTKIIWTDTKGETIEHEYGHHIDHVLSPDISDIGQPIRFGEDKYLSIQDEKFQRAFIDDSAKLGLGKFGGFNRDGILGHQLEAGFDDKLPAFKKLLFSQEEGTLKKRGRMYTYTKNVPNFDGATGISDILDAMTSGRFQKNHRVFGHGQAYYTRVGSKYKETFANLFACYGRPKAWAEVKRLFPNLATRFVELMEDYDVNG